MLYRNKFGINFHNNPLKKEDALLLRKNELESAWYDLEARGYFEQLQKSGELISMDRDFEMWFADFYDHPVGSYPYDRDSIFIRAFPRNRPLAMLELGIWQRLPFKVFSATRNRCSFNRAFPGVLQIFKAVRSSQPAITGMLGNSAL